MDTPDKSEDVTLVSEPVEEEKLRNVLPEHVTIRFAPHVRNTPARALRQLPREWQTR